MKKLLYVAVAAVLTGIGIITLFGDNLRLLFSSSAESLSGTTYVSGSAVNLGKGDNASFNRRSMKNFGANNAYDSSPIAPPVIAAPVPNVTTDTRADHLSTFAIDVDTASYSLARAMMTNGNRPDPSTVRVEEWVNAFHYNLEAPKHAPFNVHLESAPSPFDGTRTLLKVSLKGRELTASTRKPAHLVFLVDTSGSMSGEDRIGLVKTSLKTLVRQLNASDTVALVTYAGSSEVVLPPTSAREQRRLLDAIDGLAIGGGTAMQSGMKLAYGLAVHDVKPGHVSRVIVLTDGDANIGRTRPEEILRDVHNYVAEGVMLTTVGFGMGNYRAAELEKLADSGNGQALYVSSLADVKQAFVTNLTGTLQTIAKDVKVQVAFDQDAVRSYRLVGYENRDVADADFRNDRVDGGELGAGHEVTALYELELTHAGRTLGTVSVRGLGGDDGAPFELEQPIVASAPRTFSAGSTDLRFATAVALAADHLRGNTRDAWPLPSIIELAQGSAVGVPEREEFVSLLQRLNPNLLGVAQAWAY